MPTCFLHLLLSAASGAGGDAILITDRLVHLGDTRKPDWKGFTTADPEHPTQKELEFEARENKKELVLEVQAGEVGQDWKVKLNGHELGVLDRADRLVSHYFKVPSATLRDGKNRLLVAADKGGDDIYVGKAAVHDRPLAELKGHAKVKIVVRDTDTGAKLPCRLTIARRVEKKERDRDGKEMVAVSEELVEVSTEKDQNLAVRKGIVYTKEGAAEIGIAPGAYAIYATRGFEYGLAETHVELSRLQEKSLELRIRREVDTTGLLAADTHIHTKTHSGHGDINMEERMVAILGEGVEVAVATDHNHNTDYRPTMNKLEIGDGFTPVVGNEVTTTLGHFNAFPFDKDAKPPEHDPTSWVKLMEAIRSQKGVRVVILNHPQRALGKESPFAQIRLNSLSGETHRGPDELGIDAIEIANAKTLTSDRMQALRDWFALLNRGYKMKAVAASDSHSVNEIVGQARSYVVSSTDDPRKLQIGEFCDNFLAGRFYASLGLLTLVEVNGKSRCGDLATRTGPELEVKVTVLGPSWTRADRVAVYLNGQEARKEKIEGTAPGVKFQATWKIPAPRHDVNLVAVAWGPAVTAPYWPIAGGDRRYVMGATNAVWIDGDGDGKFTSAFEYASQVARAHGTSGAAVEEALARFDSAVASELASIARAKIQREAQEAYERLMAEADGKLADLLSVKDAKVREDFGDYLAAAPKVEIRTRQDLEEEAARLKKEEEDRKKRRQEAERKRREAEENKRAAGRKGRL